eukprot:COSAG06_NODE_3276_length_5572_cov_1.961637_3_plen_162_part_00
MQRPIIEVLCLNRPAVVVRRRRWCGDAAGAGRHLRASENPDKTIIWETPPIKLSPELSTVGAAGAGRHLRAEHRALRARGGQGADVCGCGPRCVAYAEHVSLCHVATGSVWSATWQRPHHRNTANCIIIAQILHFSHCLEGNAFCELPLLGVVFQSETGRF